MKGWLRRFFYGQNTVSKIPGRKKSSPKVAYAPWTPLQTHKLISTLLLVISILLFIYYKFYWRQIARRLARHLQAQQREMNPA
jgi:hypothetical protein